MVGIGTVLADNPLLTCRMENGRNPVRIICDTNLRTPMSSQVVNTTHLASTIIVTSIQDTQRHRPYLEKGCHILVVPKRNNHLDLSYTMEQLGHRNIDSILLEGGSQLNYAALSTGIVNKVQCYVAPKIFGGANGKTPVGGEGFLMEDCIQMQFTNMEQLGKDFLLEGEVTIDCSQES